MNLSNNEDVKRIVDGCAKGDRKSQHELYKALYGKMLGVCVRYASDIEEAKDLTQDGFIKIFEKIKKFKHIGSLEGWMKKIIVNNAIDYHRKKAKMSLDYEKSYLLNNNTDEDDEKEIDKMQLENLTAEKIIELIQEMSPAYRIVFNLFVIEDYSHKEIAEILNISIGTSKSNLAKAKAKLKNLYEKKYGNFKYE